MKCLSTYIGMKSYCKCRYSSYDAPFYYKILELNVLAKKWISTFCHNSRPKNCPPFWPCQLIYIVQAQLLAFQKRNNLSSLVLWQISYEMAHDVLVHLKSNSWRKMSSSFWWRKWDLILFSKFDFVWSVPAFTTCIVICYRNFNSNFGKSEGMILDFYPQGSLAGYCGYSSYKVNYIAQDWEPTYW